MSVLFAETQRQVTTEVQAVEGRSFEHLGSRLQEQGLGGDLTRVGRANAREGSRARTVISVQCWSIAWRYGGAATSAVLCACTRVYNPLRTTTGRQWMQRCTDIDNTAGCKVAGFHQNVF